LIFKQLLNLENEEEHFTADEGEANSPILSRTRQQTMVGIEKNFQFKKKEFVKMGINSNALTLHEYYSSM
uniref:Uncharacterized protein n=1 Tax=Meloidogyne floridensis TaxID=298350 RepID=A0A915NL76_9BILA